MSSEIIKKSETEVTLLIKVSETQLKKEHTGVINHLRAGVKAAGFRPGKAPDNIVEREVGAATVQSEVIQTAINHYYGHALEDAKIAAIGHPDIQIKKFVPYTELEFEAKVEILPAVKLPDYTKIKMAKPQVKIEDDKLQEVIEDLRRRMAKRNKVDRAAKTGDEVLFDFAGTKDGKPVEGATAKNHTLKLGSNQFIPGFEEELVGLAPKAEKTFTITFPKDYHQKELAGKPVEFAITLHEVTELALPELNDKFAAEVGPFKNVDELTKDIKDQLKVEAEQEANRQYENELLEEIVKASKLTLPQHLLSHQVDRLKSELEQRLATSGLDMQKYLKLQNKTAEEMEAELKPEAERRLALALVLREVAARENLKVSPEEIEAELTLLKQRYTDSTMQKELESEKVKEDIYNHLMTAKTVRCLVEYASK
ncbi:MAG TPA: trigger factor [Candidatus Dormibacteraeota bacterium]|nr:trigger factor [Candidatus Dormibacteraeota bacterium]